MSAHAALRPRRTDQGLRTAAAARRTRGSSSAGRPRGRAVGPRRIAIVGAGVTGLVAGRELARRGFAVTLVDRWPDVAGQASAFEVAPGVWLERYYHHLFPSDCAMIELHEELLPGELEWHPSTVGIFTGGRAYPFVTPRDLLTYAPLPLADRVPLGFVVLRLVGRTDWERMDDIGALEWLRRTCG